MQDAKRFAMTGGWGRRLALVTRAIGSSTKGCGVGHASPATCRKLIAITRSVCCVIDETRQVAIGT